MSKPRKTLSPAQTQEFLSLLQTRFTKNMNRHQDVDWPVVQASLTAKPEKLWSLHQMEVTEGEPDVIGQADNTGAYTFLDCAAESPKGRRSICYDQEALEARKENKPKQSALGMADEMGIEILNEEQYRLLQSYGKVDTKTSSWILTPSAIRNLGGALFADYRYGTVFVYHNGAESYYAARGFRGLLIV